MEIGENGGWRIRFDRRPWLAATDIWIYRYSRGHNEVLQPDGMVTMVREGETTDHLKPTLSIPFSNDREIMLAFMVALVECGVRHPTDVRVQGLFESQSRHLEDLRTLLKLNRGEKK